MNLKNKLLLAVTFLCLTPFANARDDIDFSGYLRYDQRYLIQQEDTPQFPMYHEAQLQVKAYPAEEVEIKVNTKLRYYDNTSATEFSDLQDQEKLTPVETLLWEAYVDLYALGYQNLDVRIGKQRINWGTSDRFNPTDNLNPDDFTDFLNFGVKVPTSAIKGDVSLFDDSMKLTVVFIPSPTPVSLPRFAVFPLTAAGSLPLPAGMSVIESKENFNAPESNLSNSMQAIKLGGSLFSTDYSISYFKGFDDLPIASTVAINPVSATEVTVDSILVLPEIEVIGLDLSGEFLSVGWWAEQAIFMPKEVNTQITMPDGVGGSVTTSETTLSDDSYIKYTLGFDYTFRSGTYLNTQLAHGFFTERGKDELHDYLVTRIEHKFLRDSLKVSLGALLETDGFDDTQDNYGLGVFPEVVWKPYDNVELTFGHFNVSGKGDALFTLLAREDQTYFKTKVFF